MEGVAKAAAQVKGVDKVLVADSDVSSNSNSNKNNK